MLIRAFHGEGIAWPAAGAVSEEELWGALAQHAIAPLLVHMHRQTQCLRHWPESLMSRLNSTARFEAIAEMIRVEELTQILALLENADIHPILTKGAGLSLTVYPARGLRPRGDTDLLIDSSQSSTIDTLLQQRGYQRLFSPTEDFLNSQSVYSKTGELGVALIYDVHRLVSNASVTFSRVMNYPELMQRALPIPECGANARTLGHVDALLLACFHRAGHFAYEGERLIWLYDIHLLAEAMGEEALAQFYAQAVELNIVSVCADALLSAQHWFGTTLPESIVERLHNATNTDDSAGYLVTGRVAGIKQRSLIEVKKLTSWRERLRFFYQQLLIKDP